MFTSILGARLSWHFADGWVFEPAIVGPNIVDYTLKECPHAGRHAILRGIPLAAARPPDPGRSESSLCSVT